jgi:hypothetical protein
LNGMRRTCVRPTKNLQYCKYCSTAYLQFCKKASTPLQFLVKSLNYSMLPLTSLP